MFDVQVTEDGTVHSILCTPEDFGFKRRTHHIPVQYVSQTEMLSRLRTARSLCDDPVCVVDIGRCGVYQYEALEWAAEQMRMDGWDVYIWCVDVFIPDIPCFVVIRP